MCVRECADQEERITIRAHVIEHLLQAGPVPTALHIFKLQDSLRKQVLLEHREGWGVC